MTTTPDPDWIPSLTEEEKRSVLRPHCEACGCILGIYSDGFYCPWCDAS